MADLTDAMFANITSTVGDAVKTLSTDINASFTLSSGYLVFFMQCGFAMLCAGSVRAKNAKNIILLNILDSCFGVMAWYITGFAFAFGDKINDDGVNVGNGFIGTQHFFLTTLPTTQYWFWFFQFAFAATGATIVSGAIAERARFEFYLFYEFLIVMWVYPVVAHWQWTASGWLSPTRTTGKLFYGSGCIDFAGCGPVHMVGGVASIAGAWILGPRIGRFDSDGKPNDMPGHNAALTLLGVFVLWFGWYGFNPGSVTLITGGASAEVGVVAVNTTLSAAGGAIGTFFACWAHNYFVYGVIVWDLIMCGNGALAGLVSITAGCATLAPWGAVAAGLLGGLIYYAASKFILYTLKLDDPLDAIAVHCFCGMWGLIAVGLFSQASRVNIAYGARPDNGAQRDFGVFLGGNGHLLASQIVQICVIFGWVMAMCIPVFLVLNYFGIMRVPPEVEAAGLDLSFHGGHVYPGEETTEKADSASILTSAAFERKLAAAVEKALANGGNGAKAV